jgi:hypothetical protein
MNPGGPDTVPSCGDGGVRVPAPPPARGDSTGERQVSYASTEGARDAGLVPAKMESQAAHAKLEPQGPADGAKPAPAAGSPAVAPGGFPALASAGARPLAPVSPKPARTAGAPMMRFVNSKRITLNFEIKDVGPSGLSGVELWYTQDCKEWKKHEAQPEAHSHLIEVDEEGMYGFTLLARSGNGLGAKPPAPGDLPQVWVVVDLTRPVIELGEVRADVHDKLHTVTIHWKASDTNLGNQPISLSYAAKEEGPWLPIAANLENSGRYVWQVPKGTPPRFFVRAEAADLAGNVAQAQAAKCVLLDTSVPSVSITAVEPGGGVR